MTARRAIVQGRVQGVGFRFFAERAARELGVRGWVRNRPDGTVEALAEGEDAALQTFIERLKRGPLSSRVDRVEVAEEPPQGFSTFEITR